MKAITATGIEYSIKKKQLLHDINLVVEEGDAFALIGENGSGKSTLIDILLGDLNPTSGNVQYFEQSKSNFNKVGVVYDQLPLFPLLKVHETLRYFSTIHKVDYHEVEKEFFDAFDIQKIKGSFIKNLSQGEKKRVGILLALIHHPKLVMLDEPFANLDPTIIGRIWKAIRGDNRTVFFTTHNWKEATQMATKIAFLHNGELVMKTSRSEWKF